MTGAPAITIDIEGDKAIAKAFKELEPKLAKKVIRQSLRKGMKVLMADAKAHSPVLTGAGRKGIRVRAARGPRGSKARSTIAIALLVGEAGGPTWYMWLQEHGFHAHMTEVPGLHFMLQALRRNEQHVKEMIINDILAGIEREAKP